MRFCLVVIVALVLSACSGKTDQAAATRKAAAAASTMPAFGGEDAVAAVLESRGTPVAQLRFVLESRPVVGQPFHLRLVVSATAATSQLLVTVESGSLRIEPGNATLEPHETETGSGNRYGASQDFTVTAQQDGLAEVTVHLTAGADTPEALYFIPVLVSKPGAAAPGMAPSDKPDPAAAANHAEPKKG